MVERPEQDELTLLRARLTALTGSDPFGALAMSARVEALARAAAAEAAVAACRRGASWSEIGDAFGISRQAAHQRFARYVKAARPR
ncbi:hypothetical protein [Micromonospora zhanjiangensis]|uniref:Homeodomain-like domain-containing protein n=1 Tax=Micromonospora zhanjiangensis TaxID=1522057 RepID=A0ABV8KSY3_9ACTN